MIMSTTRIAAAMLRSGLLMLIVHAAASHAATGPEQSYPTKPIRILTAEAGGSTDFTARLIAQGISGPLGQPVIIENRTPYQGVEIVAKAPPEGYTLLSAGNALWLYPLMRKDAIQYQVFTPITMMNISPQVLIVNPSLPVKSVKDLIAFAQSKPGVLNYSSSNPGGPSHLAGELFNSLAHVNIVRVGYRSTAASAVAVAAGETQVSFLSVGSIAQHLKAGRVRAVAISTRKSSPLVPDLPTIADSGVPGYELANINGLFALAKTPVAIIRRLNREMVQVLAREDVKQKYLSVGVEAVGGPPAELGEIIRQDIVRMGKLIKDANIRDE
jgi:tripartite-type tricarboxylate transporter receptor subunit TctC